MSDIPYSAERAHLQPPEEDEWDDCEDCGGEGCSRCENGKVPPPTRAEIRERMAEQRADIEHDEGRGYA